MDPNRRRLTVGVGVQQPPPLAKGRGKGESQREETLEQLGLSNDLFAAATASGRRVIALSTVTDREREKKRPFGDKDVVCLTEQEDQEPTKQWLQSMVGWTCNKGLKPEACNQDCLSILVVEQEFGLYGVYDGHGPYGHDVSEFVCRELPRAFLEERHAGLASREAFLRSFQRTQAAVEQRMKEAAQLSGTTVTMAYHDMASQKLCVAHVGDSRSIIGSADGKVCDALTEDHKPDVEGERSRIEGLGGRVIFDGYFNYRVFAKDAMLPGLNMSRALGDLVGQHRAGLSAEPEVVEVDLASTQLGGTGDRVLLLCTDGVWEFLENKAVLDDAIATAAQAPPEISATTAIKSVAERGYKEWLRDSDNELSDDITGIMVRLPAVPPKTTTGVTMEDSSRRETASAGAEREQPAA